VRIGVDAMGGDHAPVETVAGAVGAYRQFGIASALFGPADIISKTLLEAGGRDCDITVVDAPEVIETAEAPMRAIRRKKNSSMVRGFESLRDGTTDAFVSAGNTGALVAGGMFIVGMMDGLRRPGLATTMPTLAGRPLLLVDAGANVDPRPEQLLEYGVVGSVFAAEILKYDNPRVGLINIGVEAEKGNDLTRQAYALLQNAPIHFIGNIEARDMVHGDVDVVVADGFVGNVILKLSEGLGLGMFRLIQTEMRQSMWSKLGGLLVKGRLGRLKSLMDYASYGGAPLFGPKKPVIKCHGSSRQEAFKNGIRVACDYVGLNVIERMQARLGEMGPRG